MFCVAKFGIETKELDDGLEIYGKPLGELKEGASVHCYDDHRVAMAFSVLGSVVKDTIIEEKRCVEKTWPNWWDDLENKVSCPVVHSLDTGLTHIRRSVFRSRVSSSRQSMRSPPQAARRRKLARPWSSSGCAAPGRPSLASSPRTL